MDHFFRLAVVLQLLFFIPFPGSSQNAGSFCDEIKTLTDIIREKHYRPRELDSVFSVKAFHALMENLDPDKLYFNKSDSLKLATSKLFDTDNLFNHQCSNLELIYDLYKQRLSEAIEHFDNIKFSNKAYDHGLLADKSFSESNDQRLEHIQNYLQKEFYLNELFSSREQADFNLTKPAFDKLVASEKCKAEKLLSEFSTEGFKAIVLKTVASVFDPHTIYLTSSELEQFNHELSRKDYSFGIKLKEANGEIRVSKVIPGSSAWKSNQIHEEDVVVAIADKNNMPFPVSCSAFRDLSGILQSDSVNAINLIVEKSDGQRNKIKLLKEVINVEENVINSYLLNGRKKIGYISLPAFYGDKLSDNNPGCASDVAKEIVKLKRHNIDGLIFDLRFNSGGLLNEAIELAGIFINEGPICLVEYNDKKPTLMKDLHRGAIYNGPMVVLVNNFSASASEIFAATLQNYNRAIIAGEQTYGKSTGQSFFPVVDLKGWTARNSASDEKVDILNLTTIKLYRVDGSTYQQKGVVPDVFLPDILNMHVKTENSYPNAIDTLGTTKKVYFKKYSELPTDSLRTKSEKRIGKNAAFKSIIDLNNTFSGSIKDESKNSLNYTLIKELYNRYSENISKKSPAFLVENNYYNDQVLQINEEQRMISAEYADKINSDIYIEEAYFILTDFLEFSTNKN